MRDITLSFRRDDDGLVSVMLWAKNDQGHPVEVGCIDEMSPQRYQLQAYNPEGEVSCEQRAGALGLVSAIGWATAWAAGMCKVPA